jgi:hypothetical protein
MLPVPLIDLKFLRELAAPPQELQIGGTGAGRRKPARTIAAGAPIAMLREKRRRTAEMPCAGNILRSERGMR